MENLPISVVIVVKNAEKTLKECLDSVLRNNPAEIIVVDGISNDGTVEIAKEYTHRIYSDKGKGLGYARQLGSEQATQEYIAYVDSTVVLTEGALKTMLSELQSSGYVSIDAREMPKTRPSSYWDWAQDQQHQYARNRRQDIVHFGTTASLGRREIILKYRFDTAEKYLDDMDLSLRLERDGYKSGTSSAIIHQYHRTDLGSFASHNFFLGQVATRYIRKWGPWKVRFWLPVAALYWIVCHLLRGRVKLVPFLIVAVATHSAGMVKGFATGAKTMVNKR